MARPHKVSTLVERSYGEAVRGVASRGRSSASLRALPREGMTTDRPQLGQDHRRRHQPLAGGMLWLARKRLSGSQAALTSVRRR